MIQRNSRSVDDNMYIYIYIYIYIYSHPHTVCFVVSEFFGVARYAGRFKLGSKPTQLYVGLNIIPLNNRWHTSSREFITPYVLIFLLYTFCFTEYQRTQFVRRALNNESGSRQFLCQSAQPPWGLYIYILSSRDRLFRCITTLQCG